MHAVQGLPMSIYKYLIWIVLIIPFQVTVKDSTANSTGFSATVQSDTEMQLSKSWDLTLEDWSAYKTIMQGPRGTWAPNLIPALVSNKQVTLNFDNGLAAERGITVFPTMVEKQ